MRCSACALATRGGGVDTRQTDSGRFAPAGQRAIPRQNLCPGHGSVRGNECRTGSSMNLAHLLNARAAAGKPVRVGLIGAGKFGSMFLAQVPHTPGLEVPIIADLDPRPRARGLPHRRLGRARGSRARRSPTDDGKLRRHGADRSRRRGHRQAPRPASARSRARSPPASISSWSMSRPTCWRGRCSPRKRARPASSIRWPMATSRR